MPRPSGHRVLRQPNHFSHAFDGKAPFSAETLAKIEQPPDDTAPGTVWLTSSPEEDTTWLVASRDFPRSVSYARITPGVRAGTVTVTLAATDTGSEVTVTYDMTPLTAAAAAALEEFAAGYPSFIRSWEELITVHLA
ncbi:hypothetical protein ACFYYM_34805 [Streptomyces erythrochromogenes]|uniref:hypothetical protein n=1 Tax=Streptomyces erythrochromogenes TaxID=285574 RepID=UPI0036B4BB6C